MVQTGLLFVMVSPGLCIIAMMAIHVLLQQVQIKNLKREALYARDRRLVIQQDDMEGR